MCIGLPMQIREIGFGYAICEGMGIQREVDTLLIGDQPPGTWVLVFLNSAREVLSEDNAIKIADVVQAVNMIMANDSSLSTNGMNTQSIDALFADLIDREPPKPPSLIALELSRQTQNPKTPEREK